MIKYILVVNSEPKMYYYADEYEDAVDSLKYYRQFYKDVKLYSMKFLPDIGIIDLDECKGE